MLILSILLAILWSSTSTQISCGLVTVISPPNLNSSAAISSGTGAFHDVDFIIARLISSFNGGGSLSWVSVLISSFSYSSLYSFSQYSFHLWFSLSGSTIVNGRGTRNNQSRKPLHCLKDGYPSLHFLLALCMTFPTLPVCPFVTFVVPRLVTFCILMEILSWLLVFFLRIQKFRWRSSSCVFCNSSVVSPWQRLGWPSVAAIICLVYMYMVIDSFEFFEPVPFVTSSWHCCSSLTVSELIKIQQHGLNDSFLFQTSLSLTNN